MLPEPLPSAIPAPLPPWAKVLIQVAPFIPAGLQFVLDHFGEMFDSSNANPGSWRHFQLVFADPTNLEVADRSVTGIDIANITGGGLDSTWTDADYTAVITELDTMILAWAPLMDSTHRCVEIRSYVRQFNPVTTAEPFTKTGPPERIYSRSVQGTATAAQPPQIAVTTTERTAYPKHWGRNYWPAPATSTIDSKGYIKQASVDTFGPAIKDAYARLMAKEFFPVVPVVQIEGTPARGLLTVHSLQMDNLFDVQRRRRFKKATYKYNQPIT